MRRASSRRHFNSTRIHHVRLLHLVRRFAGTSNRRRQKVLSRGSRLISSQQRNSYDNLERSRTHRNLVVIRTGQSYSLRLAEIGKLRNTARSLHRVYTKVRQRHRHAYGPGIRAISSGLQRARVRRRHPRRGQDTTRRYSVGLKRTSRGLILQCFRRTRDGARHRYSRGQRRHSRRHILRADRRDQRQLFSRAGRASLLLHLAINAIINSLTKGHLSLFLHTVNARVLYSGHLVLTQDSRLIRAVISNNRRVNILTFIRNRTMFAVQRLQDRSLRAIILKGAMNGRQVIIGRNVHVTKFSRLVRN